MTPAVYLPSYSAMGQWRQQAHYVKLINSATEWSKAIPSYMYASSLFMCNDQSDNERAEIVRFMT